MQRMLSDYKILGTTSFFCMNSLRNRGWYPAHVHPFSSGHGNADVKTKNHNTWNIAEIDPHWDTDGHSHGLNMSTCVPWRMWLSHPAIPSQGAKIVWLYQPETLQLVVVVPSGPSLARAMRKAGYNAKTRNHTRNAAEIDTVPSCSLILSAKKWRWDGSDTPVQLIHHQQRIKLLIVSDLSI